uniref:Transmembrane protein n=1 Tax=Syphacia muris TaxID=451379 RepID=A0A0N5A8H6_9BILA
LSITFRTIFVVYILNRYNYNNKSSQKFTSGFELLNRDELSVTQDRQLQRYIDENKHLLQAKPALTKAIVLSSLCNCAVAVAAIFNATSTVLRQTLSGSNCNSKIQPRLYGSN